MAVFELNTYGKNDEILNTFATDYVRWSVFVQAFDTQEKLKEATPKQQFEILGELMKKLFPELTTADLENADIDDIFNVFTQLLRKASNIGGGNLKNAKGE